MDTGGEIPTDLASSLLYVFQNDAFAPEPFTEREAWLWISMHSVPVTTILMVDGNRVVLDPLQAFLEIDETAKAWRWSIRKIFRFLNILELEGFISIDLSKCEYVITLNQHLQPLTRAKAALADYARAMAEDERFERDAEVFAESSGPEVGTGKASPADVRALLPEGGFSPEQLGEALKAFDDLHRAGSEP